MQKFNTYSVLYSTFQAFTDKLPYVSAVLERADGSRFPCLLEGFADGMQIAIGQEVKYLGCDEQGRERYSL